MARQSTVSVVNNFSGGLKTEFTGLNFPENACTDTSNCVFSVLGDVLRREGIDLETNFGSTVMNAENKAVSYYKWTNASGDGETQIYVLQVGSVLYFFNAGAATVASPISARRINSTVSLSSFRPIGGPATDHQYECQYTDGNGYLFVFHPGLESFYCTYSPLTDTVASAPINIQIRDFSGVEEVGIADNIRPPSLSSKHQYNLQNQGWRNGAPWSSFTTSANTLSIGSKTFTVTGGMPVVVGTSVLISTTFPIFTTATFNMSGIVTSYSGTTIVVNVTHADQSPNGLEGMVLENWLLSSLYFSLIATWNSEVGGYPSNSDVWWRFKNSSDVFNPATTLNSITLSAAAPKGLYILDAFNQQRGLLSGATGLTDIKTFKRPKTGVWFQGRIWYTGVDAVAIDARSAWTENLYFSQIAVGKEQFGKCYQVNDPTDENLFDLLPTDGGVIQIQGCGSIHKLFPIQNGLLVFADNGIWFITGSQGIGFTANDYTVTKISSVRSISSTSFVNVNGLPLFWNEEGIYSVEAAQQGLGLTVNPITVGTILSFFTRIPRSSKKYVRGDYNPLTYTVQWVYKNTEETDLTSRYQFDTILNFNTFTKAFYPFSIGENNNGGHIVGVSYISNVGGDGAAAPKFRYPVLATYSGNPQFTFAEERDTNYVDWFNLDGAGINFDSYFITGYKIKGQAQRKFQPEYIYIYSGNDTNTAYKYQGIWDYATDRDTNRFSRVEVVTNTLERYSNVFRRHRIRGHGIVLQIKVSSVDGEPFNIIGWSALETQNAGV